MAYTYTYDALYRLVSATGTYTGADNKTASYTLAMGYDNMHRITSKRQILTQNNVQFNGTLNAGYDLSYTYGTDTGKKFQLANVRDVNYRTEETPSESENVNNSHAYEYDANGNLVYVNTSRTKKDGMADEKTTERKLKWDEENRLLASDDNGFVTNYWYDADGERTVKTSGESDQVYVNSEFAGGRTNTAKFSLYVSPYLVANQGGRYTKHIYIGSQRVVSKIGDFDSYGSDPRRIQYAGSETDGLSVDYKAKYAQQLQVIKDNYVTFDVPYNGDDNNDYVDGKGFCCNDGSLEAAQAHALARAAKNNFQEGDAYEKMQFYYHPDHLGSSSYITNLDGEVVQHIEYVPFGEVFVEERNNIWNTPYLFNGKEFDEETGLYYYGARYYEPRLCLWMSADPLEEKYPSVSSYSYVLNNPIKFIDAEGKEWKYTTDKNGNTIISVDVILQVEANLSQEQISTYKASITSAFNSMLKLASNNKVSGEVTFEGKKVEGIHTLILTWYSNKDSKIAGMTTLGSSTVNILKSDNTQKTGDEFASDIIHELLHTLRLEHPFEVTQTVDTELLRTGKNSYISTPNTVSDIRDNIMNYNMIIIDGKSFKETNPNGIQNKISSGQIDLMKKEIDLQQKGAGANGDYRYWSEYSGYDVRSQTK